MRMQWHARLEAAARRLHAPACCQRRGIEAAGALTHHEIRSSMARIYRSWPRRDTWRTFLDFGSQHNFTLCIFLLFFDTVVIENRQTSSRRNSLKISCFDFKSTYLLPWCTLGSPRLKDPPPCKSFYH